MVNFQLLHGRDCGCANFVGEKVVKLECAEGFPRARVTGYYDQLGKDQWGISVRREK
jgi:hypothetical protein